MQKLIKHAITCLLAGILIFSSVGCAKSVVKSLNKYDGIVADYGNAIDFMPDLKDLGDAKDVKFKCLERLFFPGGLSLFVAYDKNDYEKIKSTALFVNDFLVEPVVESMPVTELDYKDFHLKVVTDPDYDYCPCKSFGMFGYNDKTNTVAFLYYFDNSLDVIAWQAENPEKGMTDFINDNDAWH